MIHPARFLTLTTLLIMSLARPSFAEEAQELKVSRLGDTQLSCGQLSEESLLMRDIIFTTEEIKDKTKWKSRGITAAGALGSLLVGTATGGVGIAAAGYFLDYSTNEKSENADGVQGIAEQRRALMIGIYNAKGCAGPMDYAMQDSTNDKDIVERLTPDLNLSQIEPAAGENAGGYYRQGAKPRYNN